MAPTCYVEQIIYDCRIMNLALADGRDATLRCSTASGSSLPMRRWTPRSIGQSSGCWLSGYEPDRSMIMTKSKSSIPNTGAPVLPVTKPAGALARSGVEEGGGFVGQ